MRVEGNASKDLSHAAARKKEEMEIKRAAHINASGRIARLPSAGIGLARL